jgi:hypothetical protein
MKQVRLAFRLMFFVSIMLMLASFTQAQTSRTWISGVGDDVNPCTRTAPCKTFAGAISKTMMGGEIDLLDADGAGSVTITKSITIDGTGSMASIMAAASTGITINITDGKDTAKAVRLRGLSINGQGTGSNGINIVAANSVTIEESVVDGFTGNGINVNAGAAFVRNTSIRNNVVGISVSTGATAGLADVSLVFNSTSMVGDTLIQQFGGVVSFGNKKGNSSAR